MMRFRDWKVKLWKLMRHDSGSLKVLMVFFVIALLVVAAPTSGECAKRVGIVFSAASADNWWGDNTDPANTNADNNRFAYSQFFMAMQHQAMMAGIPFDVLSESDLINSTALADYSALILAPMPYAANAAGVLGALQAAAEAGVGIISDGNILNYTDWTTHLNALALLGITITDGVYGVPATITATADVSHPILRGYTANEQLMQYSAFWFGVYAPIASEGSTTLANINADNTVYPGAIATTINGRRNVFFANDQVMGHTNLVWSALQWVIYGDQTPVGLKMGRNDNIFISRNDMDMSMEAELISQTEVPLLNLLNTWKQRYNFVGSYYINIGNDPTNGYYTNWAVSAPLYNSYIQLGNEIGTHSYTHPDYTSLLTPAQLEFEFNQSMLEIESQLGIEVTGTAIPGNPEPLSVDWALNSYFEYVSGRWCAVDSGYPGAFGYLTPDYSMLYFSLNMSPDFTLMEYAPAGTTNTTTPAQATQIWANQHTALRKHASQPIIQWLWHDYAPTTGSAAGGKYTVKMFEDTIAMAYNNGSEFATADDIQKRITALQAANFDTTDSGTTTTAVVAAATAQVGQFSLQLNSNESIASVNNWYAYDTDQVFIPQNGGTFVINRGTPQAQVTRITALPMRAKLVSLTGNGTDLSFVFEGEGTVIVELNPALLTGYAATGADSTTLSGTTLRMNFTQAGSHTASVAARAVNHAPVANAQSVSATRNTACPITLTASDVDGDPLTMRVTTNPRRGRLTGTAPNLTYTPNRNVTGTDSFTFVANDGQVNSARATVTITINRTSILPGCGS